MAYDGFNQINGRRRGKREESGSRGKGLPNPSRETKCSRVNADGEIFIFLVLLTTCRIGNLTRLIHTLAISNTCFHKCIHVSKGLL